jgi:hypothetical protein
MPDQADAATPGRKTVTRMLLTLPDAIVTPVSKRSCRLRLRSTAAAAGGGSRKPPRSDGQSLLLRGQRAPRLDIPFADAQEQTRTGMKTGGNL